MLPSVGPKLDSYTRRFNPRLNPRGLNPNNLHTLIKGLLLEFHPLNCLVHTPRPNSRRPTLFAYRLLISRAHHTSRRHPPPPRPNARGLTLITYRLIVTHTRPLHTARLTTRGIHTGGLLRSNIGSLYTLITNCLLVSHTGSPHTTHLNTCFLYTPVSDRLFIRALTLASLILNFTCTLVLGN
ncbi:hypothetical protein RUND412_003366 [Rhizina undulata]